MNRFTRRDALRAVGTATVVGLAGCQTGATDELCGTDPPSTDSTIPTEPMSSASDLSSAAAWPTYQHDAAQTGFTDEAGPKNGVRLAWSATLAGGDTHSVVTDGTVVVSASDPGVLRALSPTDGSVEWSVDSLFRATPPAIVEGSVVVGDRAGLHAFGLGNGTEQWTFAPEVERTETVSQQSADGETAVATTREDGQSGQSDTTPADVRNAAAFSSAPLYADGVIIAKSRVGVHALAPDGTERWRRERLHLGAVADGIAYLLGEPGLVAIDVRTGEKNWSRERTGIGPEIAIRGGTIYGGTLDSVSATDAASGETQWTFEGESEQFASPTVTPDAVFAASSPKESEDGGNLYALDRETGEPNWCTYLGFKGVDSPAATGDTVFVPTENAVEARAAEDGDLRWRYGTSGEFTEFRAPAVADGHLLVGTHDGSVFAFAEA